MENVYIFNGYEIYGGSYMLYQIGRVCHEAFGSDVFIVQDELVRRGKRRFRYPYNFPTITTQEMFSRITKNDLFICTPAHSHLDFGTRLQCQKLMYLQGVTSYSVVDPNFDQYISVSQFVKDVTREKFNIDTPIIHPFINHTIFKADLPWEERRDELLVLCYKKDTIRNLSELTKRYKHLKIKKIGSLPQVQWAQILSQHKFYLTLTSIEGFGLPPLEAMATGSVVIGFDAYGGRDYFTTENALVVPSGNYDQLISKLDDIQQDPENYRPLSKNAIKTASHFNYENFKRKWLSILTK